MRLGKTILSILAALALAVLPLGGFAHAKMAEQTLASVSQMADEPISVGPSTAVLADAIVQMDDCCLPHGVAGDACASAACCSVHCAGVAPIVQNGFLRLPRFTPFTPVVRDQVFASVIGSPPFRPPRV